MEKPIGRGGSMKSKISKGLKICLVSVTCGFFLFLHFLPLLIIVSDCIGVDDIAVFFMDDESRYKKYFKSQLNVTLPAEASLQFFLFRTGFRHGDHVYFAWQFEKEDKDFLNVNGFTDGYAQLQGEEKDKFLQNVSERLDDWVFPIDGKTMADVPPEYRPDWNGDFLFAGLVGGESEYSDYGASYYYTGETNLLLVWGDIY